MLEHISSDIYRQCRDGGKCKTICFAILFAVAAFLISTGWLAAVGFALLYTFGIKLPITQITTFSISLSVGAAVILGILVGGCCLSYMAILTGIALYFLCKMRLPAEKQDGNPPYTYTAINWSTSSSTKPRDLIHLSAEFQRLVNLDALMPHLCKEGLLHSSDMDEWLRVKPSNSRTIQIIHILTILDKKGQSGVCGLIRALKEEKDHTGHIDLVEILVKEYSDIAKTADKRSPHYYNRSQSSFA